jgi:uncharacterized protein (DUF362 family)
MKENNVFVYKTSPNTLEGDIAKLLNTPDFQLMNPEKETLIKINANYDRDWPGCNTSKWFLNALLKNLRKKGFDNLKAIEGDLKLQPAIRTIKEVGFDKLLEKYNIPFLPIENLPREGELPTILNNTQLISTPVLHTHTFAGISVAAKNLYGLLPVYREKFHKILPKKLFELVNKVKVFSIVDGTVGLDGGSMRMGNPRRCDLILGGWDPIAIDIVATKIMGFSMKEVPHLNFSFSKNDSVKQLMIKGDFSESNLPQYNFEYKKSTLSNLDLWIRGNWITGGLFEYNSLFDRLGNHLRRSYTGYVYQKKKKKVLEGDWKEYEKEYNKKYLFED